MIRFSLPPAPALASKAAALLPTLLLLCMTGLPGCDPAPTLTQTTIPGARFLTLRCIDNDGQGAPLDGCGCVERVEDADGMVQFRQMGRVECDCRALDAEGTVLSTVRRVQADCSGGECVAARDPDSGDFIPVESSAPASSSIACTPARSGEVHGYVGTVGRGEIAVLDLITDPDDTNAKAIVDIDRTIPGITAVYIGDLISDVETHPNGDFVFAVNSSSGSLTLVRTDDDVLPLATVELGEGPLLDAAVWPAIGRAQPRGARPLAFVSAPLSGKVLQLDLAALAEAEGLAPDVVTATFSLPGDAAPGRLAVHPDGTALLVAHARTPQITVFDLTGRVAPRTIELAARQECADGYLVRLLEDDEPDVTCTDGLDNDGDGQIDADDDSCTGAARTEADDPRCAKLSECVDGIDNDDDGLIDAADPDCAGDCAGDDCPALAAQLDWERPEVPACADGLDNDADGLIDRLDPGCEDEGDISEADAVELKGTPACSNGEDDDADGLVDDLDPGCTDDDAALRYSFERITECADGIDNDADGLIDADADPECWGAADASEARDALSTGPTEVLTMRIDLAETSRVFAYVIDGAGNLLWIDMDDAALPVSRLNLGRVSPLAIAARQIGQISSLLVVGNDTTLRSIEVSAPTPLRTEDGLPIFGRLDPERSDINGGRLHFTAFYVVDDGVAYAVDGLDDLREGPDDTGYPARNPVHLDRADPIVMGAPEDRVPLSLIDASGRYAAFDRGRLDPLLYAAPSTRTLLHDEANVVQTAQGRTNRVAGIPRFQYGNSPAQFDAARHPAFCQLPQPSASGEIAEPTGDCVPTGYTANGQIEARVETDARTEFRTDLYEGVRVIEDRVESVLPGTFTVAYQGDLPSSDSRTGQFAGRAGDDAWTMVDYNEDFCRIGVEAGDVLLVDVFVPKSLAAGETLPPECRALKPENRPGDPLLLREPLRYKIASVTAHQLELVRDDSTAVDQLPRDERAEPLGYFEPPPAPLEACAAQFIAYHVRAGKDDWVLTGPGGYRHPWVNAGGQCVQSPSRVNAGRVSRAKLDEPFENEWFRFTIGAFRGGELAETGVPSDRQPHLLDARFLFDVATGVLHRRLVDYVVTPGGMKWLPNDDRVYTVDTAFETLVEAAGLNVYRQVMAQIRRFR